jgi:hypothetical protein
MATMVQDRDLPSATERQRRVWDRRASRYDRPMGLMEKIFFVSKGSTSFADHSSMYSRTGSRSSDTSDSSV